MVAMVATVAYCVAGSNAGAPGGAALHVLECDTATGETKIVQDVPGTEGATYFVFSPDNATLYAAAAREGKRGALIALPFDGKRLGAPQTLAELPCEPPCHVELSPDGCRLSYAAYLSGAFGFLDLKERRLHSAVLPDAAPGPRKDRQKKPYAHQTFYTPGGSLMGVCDLGCDRILFYKAGEPGGLDTPEAALAADPGDGPRHALFHPSGRFMFVVNELSSTVASFSWNGETFGRVCKVSMLPEGCVLPPERTKASAIKLSADGSLLMASNRGHDSIAFFAVGADGTLTPRGVAPLRGRFPRDFEPLPGGRFVLAGHKLSDEFRVYALDAEPETNEARLEPAWDPVPCWKPLCFKFPRSK